MITVHVNVHDSAMQCLMCLYRVNQQRAVCRMRDGLRLYVDTTGEAGKKTLETGEERQHVAVLP
jgi:hypothetical protein